MISIEFTRSRAQATRDTQASLVTPPANWLWPEKTVIQWDTDITTLDQQIADESAKRTQWRNAAELWQDVEQAVISNLVTGAGTVHFDVAAAGATRFTFLHQSPGSPAFVVVVADSPEAHLSLTGQPAGLHRFKAFGSNSGGAGPESAVTDVTVSAAAAA